jgi:hypothetical protein
MVQCGKFHSKRGLCGFLWCSFFLAVFFGFVPVTLTYRPPRFNMMSGSDADRCDVDGPCARSAFPGAETKSLKYQESDTTDHESFHCYIYSQWWIF